MMFLPGGGAGGAVGLAAIVLLGSSLGEGAGSPVKEVPVRAPLEQLSPSLGEGAGRERRFPVKEEPVRAPWNRCQNLFPYGVCVSFLSMDADFYCAEYFCDECSFAHHCDTYCGFCSDAPLSYDCKGNEFPTAWVGDGQCDIGLYMSTYDSELIDLNCPLWNCDGGDCPDDPCETSAPTTATAAPTANVDIASIQFQESRDTDVLFYDYDCYRSTMEKSFLTVRGHVTGVFFDGFYIQDAAALWSGIHAYTGSKDRILNDLTVGDSVTITNGFIDERLGETQFEITSTDVTIHDDPAVFMTPMPCTTLELGGYNVHAIGEVCGPVEAERYEGVLVEMLEVTLLGFPDAFSRITIRDESDGTAFLATGEAQDNLVLQHLAAAANCEGALRECDFTGLKLASVRGVVKYVRSCDYNRFSYYECLNQNEGLKFAYAVTPRTTDDVGTTTFNDGYIAEAAPTHAPTVYDALAPTELEQSLTINEIQVSMDDDAEEHPYYNCGPSTYIGTRVAVEGRVTARDSFGFYMQDDSTYFSGIFVAVFDDTAGVVQQGTSPAATLALGQRVLVRGKVAESLGSTLLEAYSLEPYEGDIRLIQPLQILSSSLGTFKDVTAEGCSGFPRRAERYESVLVRIVNSRFSENDRCDDCFDGVPINDGSGLALLDDSLYAVDGNVAAKIAMVSRLYDSARGEADITGVVRYTYRCEYTTNPVYCLSGRADFYFAYLLSPRDEYDIRYEESRSTDTLGGSSSSKSKSKSSIGAVVLTVYALLLALLILGAVAGCTCARNNARRKREYWGRQFEVDGVPMAQVTEVELIPAQPMVMQARAELPDYDEHASPRRGSTPLSSPGNSPNARTAQVQPIDYDIDDLAAAAAAVPKD